MKKINQVYTNQKGLTLVEVMVTSAIFVVVSSALIFYLNSTLRDQKNLEAKIDDSTDLLVGERFLERDLIYISASMFGWTISDINNKNFFDFIPDYPDSLIINKSREIKLEKSDQEIVFLVDQPQFGVPLVYDPTSAYQVGEKPNINTSAPLTFVSVNNGSVVTNQRPDFFKDNHLILLDAPVFVRPKVKGVTSVNMQVPPRSPAFLGVVNGNSVLKATDLIGYFNFTNPYNNQVINDVDQFFRQLPSLGGGSPYVRIRVVQVVKYFLMPAKEGGRLNLYRAVYANGAFQKEQLVSERVKFVRFYRASIASSLLSYTIEKEARGAL